MLAFWPAVRHSLPCSICVWSRSLPSSTSPVLESLPPYASSMARLKSGRPSHKPICLRWPPLPQKLPARSCRLAFCRAFPDPQQRDRLRLHCACRSIIGASLALALLGGEIVLRSRKGTRVLTADEFQQGMLMTAREPDELITAVRFPVHKAVWRFERLPAGTGILPSLRLLPQSRMEMIFALGWREWRIARLSGASLWMGALLLARASTGSPGSSGLRGHACFGAHAARSVARHGPARRGRGEAMRRVSRNERAPCEPHAQRPDNVGGGGVAHVAVRLYAVRARRDRDPCGMRAWRVRLLHGPARWGRRCARA